ncbi:MAG: DoxX family protein [Ignavibacteria bacterium]|nr:DoxX family protein [Ignavibacteria bacterium]
MKHSDFFTLIIRLTVGIFFLYVGVQKINSGWLTSNERLNKSLYDYNDNATGIQNTYLDKLAIPFSSIWAPLIALGETALGVSLLIGLFTRTSTLMGLLMILNFHFANGNLFSADFFESSGAIVLCGTLLYLFFSYCGYSYGLDALISVNVHKRKGKSKSAKIS